MCNASVQLMNVVENEVLQRMQARNSFTALDISNALKVVKYPVRHREVAEVVRDIYNSGAMQYYDYDRQLIDVTTEGGAKTAQAYLYHHQNFRVTDYADPNQDALPPVPADQARDLSDCVAADPLGLLQLQKQTASANNRLQNRSSRIRLSHGRQDGALAISSRIITELGWADGDALAVRSEQGKLIVEASAAASPSHPSSHPSAVTARVWNGRRVRICKTKLQRSALAADGVIVSVDGSRLCIAARP